MVPAACNSARRFPVSCFRRRSPRGSTASRSSRRCRIALGRIRTCTEKVRATVSGLVCFPPTNDDPFFCSSNRNYERRWGVSCSSAATDTDTEFGGCCSGFFSCRIACRITFKTGLSITCLACSHLDALMVIFITHHSLHFISQKLEYPRTLQLCHTSYIKVSKHALGDRDNQIETSSHVPSAPLETFLNSFWPKDQNFILRRLIDFCMHNIK
jgi:hypothetical protein